MARQNPFRFWFDLTAAEQRLVIGVLALAGLGLVARYMHLSSQ